MNTQAQAMQRYQGGLHVDPDVLMTGMRQISRVSEAEREREPLRMNASDFEIFAAQVAQARNMVLQALEGVNGQAASQLRNSLAEAELASHYPGVAVMERRGATAEPQAESSGTPSRQQILHLVQAARTRVQVATESLRGVSREQILQQAWDVLEAIDDRMADALLGGGGPHTQSVYDKLAAMRDSLDQVVTAFERETGSRMRMH
jgi:predicted alpha/beta-fold hydrolase